MACCDERKLALPQQLALQSLWRLLTNVIALSLICFGGGSSGTLWTGIRGECSPDSVAAHSRGSAAELGSVPAACAPHDYSDPGALPAVSSGAAIVTDGIFWSAAVEALLPKERSHRQRHWRHLARTMRVSTVSKGCGNLRGAYVVTFEDGRTRACARPQNDLDLFLGVVYAPLLAGLLGLGSHLPTTVLALPPERDPERWSSVAEDIADWRWAHPVVFVDLADESRLERAYLPASLFPNSVSWPPLAAPSVADLPASKAAALAQWSDLVLFDYLTAHADRVVNNVVNSQWGNPEGWRQPVHKMAVDSIDRSLLYTDNEGALFQGYSLLDASYDGQQYAAYHDALLSRLCVFRRPTVSAIEKYHVLGNVGEQLAGALERHEKEAQQYLPYLSGRVSRTLQHRLAYVVGWVRNCSAAYGADHDKEPVRLRWT